MKIESGKYYKTRDGQKVGPMKFDHEADVYVWDCATTHKCWGSDGEYLVGYGEHNLDLIAEWTDTPKLWRDMTPEEKGALLLAHHEGKIIEYSLFGNGDWEPIAEASFAGVHAYRIKPEPKAETVTLHGRKYVTRTHPNGVWDFDRNERQSDDTYRITFSLIDGKPDLSSIRMEEL